VSEDLAGFGERAESPPRQPLPSIGRIVHYVNLGDQDGKYPPEIQAAVITGVYKHERVLAAGEYQGQPTGGTLKANRLEDKADVTDADLKVFYRTGFFDTTKVPFSAEYKRGCWSWPPRV
jgi:hypothetical protein